MPYYKGIIDEIKQQGFPQAAQKVADTLLRLRTQLKNEIPLRNINKSILIATWNIREFGRNDKCGIRLPESILYIAEIISHFDLVAVQEVNENLADLKRLMKVLGDWWNYIVTDVTSGPSGNQERIAFIYDSRTIIFDHLAGELALPAAARAKATVEQPARSPFICGFRSGWRRLSLCSVHIYYGKGTPNDPRRVREIDAIASILASRNTKRQSEADGEPDNIVLIGDFNIFNRTGDKTTDALLSHDFVIPSSLKRLPGSNLTQDKYYDQIAFHDPTKKLRTTSRAGVFDFTKVLFSDQAAGDHEESMSRSSKARFEAATNKKAFYKQWRTFQISDHFPLWLELHTDFADAYLASVMRGKTSKQ